MTTIDLITELNICLGDAAKDRDDYRDGLNRLYRQFEAVKREQFKRIKKQSCKAKRKSMKKELRNVERVFQQVL